MLLLEDEVEDEALGPLDDVVTELLETVSVVDEVVEVGGEEVEISDEEVEFVDIVEVVVVVAPIIRTPFRTVTAAAWVVSWSIMSWTVFVEVTVPF